MRKYASLEVLESWRVPQQAGPAGLRKAAHRVAFDYTPRAGYLYVRSRMISSRTNDNHDTFPAGEIEKGYRTFLGKPVFINHHNANHRRARGVVVAVALHRDRNPDKSPDTWVEGLMEIDAQRFPKLAQAILAGKVNRTSMGVDVEWSRCSACGNKATSPAEYCHHLPALKGKKIRKTNPVTGKVEERLIHEICAGLSFFENSLLVEEPADPTAYFLGRPDDRGLGKTAAQVSPETIDAVSRGTEGFSVQPQTGKAPDSGYMVAMRDRTHTYPAEIMQDHHRLGRAIHQVLHTERDAFEGDKSAHLGGWVHGGKLWVEPSHNIADRDQAVDEGRRRNQIAIWDAAGAQEIGTGGTGGGHITEHDADGAVTGRRQARLQERSGRLLRSSAGPAGQDLRADRGRNRPGGHRAAPGSALLTQGAKAQGGDHPFFRANPVSSANVVAAYHDSTDDERSLGDRWYADAHHVAKGIAGGDAAKGAGLLSAYSPRTAWPVNMFNASRAAQGDPPGPGSGAMGSHQKPAMGILAGKHWKDVLKGPKTRAFAHLIEHGGDTPEDESTGQSRVVIDRHAMSVAIGHRMSDTDDAPIGTGQEQHYEHVAQTYRDAASTLSQATGRKISPHQVQATTWLRQVRKNRDEDSSDRGASGKGRVKRDENARARWKQHHPEAHPGGVAPENMHFEGRRVLAYGETRVPPQVDTLRMEECPVCGEHDVWSGERCPVCGFIVPPSLFRDPDVTKAQQVRQELDQEGEVVTQPGTPGDPATQQIGSGFDADNQLMNPDQVAPDGTPGVQGEGGPVPAADTDGLPPLAQQGEPGDTGEEAQGESEEEQGEEDEQAGAEEEAEGQELENQGEEAQLGVQPDLMCSACGAAFATDMAAQPGTPCPACRQGSLQPAGGPPEGTEDPDAEDEEDEDAEMAGSKTGAALARAQSHRIAVLTAENEVLTEQLRFLASAAGVDRHLDAIRSQVLRRHADVLNPASPVPDPPEAPATESTEQALQPLAQDDPSRPGSTPGANVGVPAQQMTTAITPGVEMQTPPATNLIDVTAPVTGTNPSQDGGVPIQQRRIETDVRINPDPLAAHGPGIGGLGDNGAAFPWMLEAQQPQGQGQQRQGMQTGQGMRAAALNGGSHLAPPDEAVAANRTFASIRLAKLRIATGSVQGDELMIAERIEKDGSLPTALIEHEIAVLSRMPQQPAYPQQRQMQRAGAARQAPSLASVGASMGYAPAAMDDMDGADLFL